MRPWFAPLPQRPRPAPAPVEVAPAVLAAAYEAETSARRRHWLIGVPTPADLAATRKAVASRFRVPVEAVVNALSNTPSKED